MSFEQQLLDDFEVWWRELQKEPAGWLANLRTAVERKSDIGRPIGNTAFYKMLDEWQDNQPVIQGQGHSSNTLCTMMVYTYERMVGQSTSSSC
jgi:hypothetical protein